VVEDWDSIAELGAKAWAPVDGTRLVHCWGQLYLPSSLPHQSASFPSLYQSQPSSHNAQLQDLALLWLGSVRRPKLGILSLFETLIPANSTSLIFVIEACLSVLCVPARL